MKKAALPCENSVLASGQSMANLLAGPAASSLA